MPRGHLASPGVMGGLTSADENTIEDSCRGLMPCLQSRSRVFNHPCYCVVSLKNSSDEEGARHSTLGGNPDRAGRLSLPQYTDLLK